MDKSSLTHRESEIVELAIQGLTNESIAERLGVSVVDVNTSWLRIRMKFGEVERTASVARMIRERADRALRAANVEMTTLADHVSKSEQGLFDLRASLALLHLAMEQVLSAVWATDKELRISLIANGALPKEHFGVVWEAGKTIYDVFKSKDPEHPPIAAHLAALNGFESTLRLEGDYRNILLRTLPLRDESHEIMGCVGILNYVES